MPPHPTKFTFVVASFNTHTHHTYLLFFFFCSLLPPFPGPESRLDIIIECPLSLCLPTLPYPAFFILGLILFSHCSSSEIRLRHRHRHRTHHYCIVIQTTPLVPTTIWSLRFPPPPRLTAPRTPHLNPRLHLHLHVHAPEDLWCDFVSSRDRRCR
jgi:hypothetical protein